MNNVLDLLQEVFDGIERTLDVNSVIGTPITNGDSTVIPISRMTIGFGSGGGEIESKNLHKSKDPPIGALGGGASISPIGFLVLDGFSVNYIRAEGGEVWGDAIGTVLNLLTKK